MRAAAAKASRGTLGPMIDRSHFVISPRHNVLGASFLALAVLAACASEKPASTAVIAPPASLATATVSVEKPSTTSTASVTSTPATVIPPSKTRAASTAAKPAKKTTTALFGDMTQPGQGTPKPRVRTAAPTSEGTVIPGAVSVYTFDPKESFIAVDATTTSLAQVLADLGPDAIEWYQHVQTLSNPWFEGRAPGSAGIEHAAEYVQFYMEKSGLEPAFASGATANAVNAWRQPFDLPGGGRTVASGTLTFGGTTADAPTAKAMKNSGGGTVSLPIAFVGYGIESGKDGYSSFAADERLEGRIAIVMRGEPLDAEGKSMWGGEKFTSASSLASKIEALVKRGANGIIVTEAPGYAGKKADLGAMSADSLGGEIGVPCFFVDTATVDSIVKVADAEGRDLVALRARADSATKDAPATTALGKDDAKIDLTVNTDSGAIVTHNVGGILRGKGALADQWIIVGAHYDHVGMGAYGSSPANRGKVHPGADDNASGTSGMLVMTKRLAKDYAEADANANLRSVLFLAFSAEELGLNGSRAFVKSPSVPADKVDVMLNMDMIGRMRAKELVVGGVESANGFSAALDPMFKASGLTVRADPSGRGPSDHASFYGAGIPVLFFFSGVHDIYHQPGDQGYTVDPRGVPAILDLVEKIALWRASSPERLEFATASTTATARTGAGGSDRGYAGVRLGIQPGLSEDGDAGVLVESVSAGTSAADAGIKAGDTLLTWNGESLDSTAIMMTKLRAAKAGDVVKVKVLRDGAQIEIDITLKASTTPRRPQND